MNCNEIRELISCMLDGQLSAEDSAMVTEHLAECPDCMRAFEAFHAVSLALEELEDVPVGFTSEVMNRIKASKTKQKRKRPISIFRTAGMVAAAACAALVMLAGTRFASTHMYIGGGNGDTAEYVHIKQNTPAPASEDEIDYLVSDEDLDAGERNGADGHSTIGEAAISDGGGAFEDTTPGALTATPFIAANMASPEVQNTELTEQVSTPTPQPTVQVTPTPMPNMDLLFITDLLLAAQEAEFDLFTEYPAYEVTITAEDGTEVTLKIWIDGKRIYCKDEATGTAWYTFGTTEQLMELLGEPAAVPEVIPEAPVTTDNTPANN